MAKGDHGALRFSHGFLFQHLIESERTIGELAERVEISQQAVSKVVAELEALGYVERVVDAQDARVRRVRLGASGRRAVAEALASRAALEKRLAAKLGPRRMAAARRLLAEALEALGGADALRARRVQAPR